ncbi:acyl carrier protein [Lysobacteraceae bacterium NML75-0749]|nr:acyl carrier protein [Xanthomonadaceae bacterium NML75-0749]PJK04891.1 acyl carrier protein [Xanthomonadaceae bacterium NML91-0268]PJK05242.1 acyl carrier protein [Xanthomonadaceae bacterium NML71-0210]
MNDTTNTDLIVSAFSKVLGLPEAQITDELQYASIPQWDSIAHMSVIAALEEAFGIMIDMDDVIDMNSVSKARQIVKKYTDGN